MSVPGFGRLMTAMVTPFHADGEVDYDRAAELARRLVAEGTDTLVVCGTTGESPTLTRDEKLRLFETVKKAVGDTPVVAGTGSYCTRSTIELSKAAEERGVDGLLIVTPYYNKPPQEGLFAHFRSVAEAVKTPVIVYNIPGRTGVEIAPKVLAQLAELPNVVAVKESLPSLEPVSVLAALLERAPVASGGAASRWTRPDRAMEIYSGDDSATLPMMALGAMGVVSVASHVAGPQMQEMMKAFAAGRLDEARRIHLRLYPLFTGLFATTNPILPKAALKLKGFPVGGVRLPLVDSTPEQEAVLAGIMRDAGVL